MRAVLAAIIVMCLSQTVLGQDLPVIARFLPSGSWIAGDGVAITVDLALSHPVPWRVRLLDRPPRLVIDMRAVDWTGIDGLRAAGPQVRAISAGVMRPGWSRLVVELDGPYRIASSAMTTDPATRVTIRLAPTAASAFSAEARRPEPPEWALPPPDGTPALLADAGPLTVVIDPGHGGIDPGAERDDLTEADLMLTVARDLKEALLRAGGTRVILTREEDIFVPLEARITIAREVSADLFLSLHADALAEGEASGATIYTLADTASDAASAALAERHDRDDLLAGIDLSAQDDVVATVLMDMARTATDPRTDRLAAALEAAIQGAGLGMHPMPRQQAAFSVLKSPDVPSALLELGFLSSAGDRKRLTDPDWRAQMVGAIVAGIGAWADEEAALKALSRP
jgi:N-acetylmuramoyl-L-alanine amidase